MPPEDNAGVEGEVTPPVAPVEGEIDGAIPPVDTPAEPVVEPVEPAAEPAIEAETVTLTKEEHDRLNKRITDKDTFIRTQQSELDKIKSAPPAEPTPTPAVNTSGKPQLDNYDDYEQYNEALMDWKLAEKDTQKTVNDLAKSEEAERQERINNFAQKANVFRAEKADFDEVANAPEIAKVYGQAPHLADIVESSEAGPEIAYYFGNNPDIAAKIGSMPPYQAAIEIGKLEAKVQTAPKPKNITQAPTPISTVGGGHDPAEKSVDDMSQAEYEAARKAGKL
jgi:hypothetical protein